MKIISDQAGIMNRYLAEEDNWESHLQNTREFITGCLEQASPSSVAVLGSGWLLDVPFEYLASRMEKVYLVDIYHPPQIIHKAKKHPNTEIVRADLTGGGIKGTWDLVREYRITGRGSILDIACQAVSGVRGAEYIISINLLNQLDILLVDYIGTHMEVPEEEKTAFRKRIQEQHLRLLPDGRSCLVSDVEERIFPKEGAERSVRKLVYTDLPEGRRNREWTWTFDTRGTYNRGRKTEMLVKAIQL